MTNNAGIIISLFIATLAVQQQASADEAAGTGILVPLADCVFDADATAGPVSEALNHFTSRAMALGAGEVRRGQGGAPWIIHVGVRAVETLPPPLSATVCTADLEGIKPFQRTECYWLAGRRTPDGGEAVAAGLETMGAVHAISELEQRLRVKDGRVFMAFPEWGAGTEEWKLFDKPVIEGRGEYINIGYNYPDITPHEWGPERWRAYIDKMVLARLNTLYFYLWIDTYTIYPGSELSKNPLNQRLHENLKEAIRYARLRGLKVIYLACPTYFPRDVWDKHPEMHADIEYVAHGFSAACPSAPGAWDLMKDIARSEMEWFREADGYQIWFYDPGGCWCERNGCAANQAAILARQVKEFGALFREFNPQATIEVNIWPMWLWESMRNISYRENLGALIQKDFGEEASRITMVGAPDNEQSQPKLEQGKGFRTGIFIFATNPERSYVFTIPLLRYTRIVASEMAKAGYNDCFGHRLEAWTRYPGTYFMAQFLWNPDAAPESVARKFADWQTADADAGKRLAEALMLLERFSDEGASTELSSRMRDLVHGVYDGLPDACRADLDYFPPMFDALDILSKAALVEDKDALKVLSGEFSRILGESSEFRNLVPMAESLFTSYRGFVKNGWAKEIY